MTGNTRTGMPYCERSSSAWRALGDKFDLARALNLEAHARRALGQFEQAAALFKEAREIFLRNGDVSFASTVGANLATAYIDLERPAEALELLRNALDAETRGGRFDNALRSRLDIARALVKLNQPQQALAEVTAAIADAHAHGWKAKLADLLTTQAKLARDGGDLQLALSAQDQIIELQTSASGQAHSTAMAELEARYAARERELRIGELEQQNRRRELELRAARATAAEDELDSQRQRLRLAIAALAALALGLSSALLYLMWRSQQRKAEALRAETLHDSLTGVENRRSFLRRMGVALTKPSAAPHLDVLMILDLDHFKQINDRGGHLFGDQVLIAVVACLERTLAGRAHLARLGGEEFGVLGVALGVSDGLRLAEQLRTAVSQLPFRLGDDEVRTTISIGFAVHDSELHRHDQSSWLGAADMALYSAKAHGRNRVVSAAVA